MQTKLRQMVPFEWLKSSRQAFLFDGVFLFLDFVLLFCYILKLNWLVLFFSSFDGFKFKWRGVFESLNSEILIYQV